MIKSFLAVVAVGLLGSTMLTTDAAAVPITGGISLSGGYTTDTGNVNTANAFTAFTTVFVTSTSGSYAAAGITAPTAVTMTPYTFDPFPGGGVVPLWSTAVGPSATFSLLTLTSVVQEGDDALEIRGVGTLTLAGYDDTIGTYIFTANQAGGTFSFSSSNAAVPDGGTTAALLGLSLLGVAVVSRKLGGASMVKA